MDKKMAPELRFEGFEEPWEEKKLGDFGHVAMNKRIFKEQTNETGDVPFFKIGTFGKSPDAYITRELFEDYKKRYPYPKVGTLLISAAGSIGRTVQYAGEDAYYQDSNIVWLEHNELLDDGFLKVFYSSCKWSTLEGTTLKRLYNKDILSTDIAVPIVQEQKALGEAFYNLDSHIAEQEKKCAALSAVKSSMLDKMFPKEGETEPELRFEGFAGPWERVRLGELYRSVNEKNNLTFGRDKIISVANMYFNTNVNVTEDSYLLTYNVMRLGDIAFEGHHNNQFSHGRFVENYIGDGIVSHIFKVLRPVRKDHSLLYWKYAINNERIMGPILTKSTKSSTMMHELVTADFLEESILVPSLNEQRAIGTAIDSIDRLITLHQRKYETLRATKAAMLDKMFPKGA